MSDAIRAAIYNRLSGTEDLSAYPTAATAQTALVALLGDDLDENGSVLGPAIVRNFTDGDRSFPQVAFRENSGVPSLQGVDVGINNSVFVDFEYWEKVDADGGSVLTEIDKNIEILLHLPFRLAPIISLTSGRLLWHEGFTEMEAILDEKLNLRAGVRRFIFEEARYY